MRRLLWILGITVGGLLVGVGLLWFGYGLYKPVMVGKRLDIFRVFYNFVEVGRDKQPSAMRLGLAKCKITIEDIIYYQQQS